jgi:ADP-ribose pyrophosphatase YjhB (NUDIX family)
MAREYPAYPLPGVLALVLRGDRFLMVLRDREPDRGKWGFPGGAIEVGETVAEAALRELREETGVEAEAGPVIDVFDAIIRDADGRVRFHYVISVVRCHWRAGEGVAGDDAADIGWFDLSQAEAMVCSRNVDRLARMALARG